MMAGLLEGLAAAHRGWEPSCLVDTLLEAPHLHMDAAETPWRAYMVGLWGLGGARIRRCPVWVTSQRSAKQWGVVVAMDEMRRLRTPTAHLYMDNAGALAMIMWGRARAGLPEQRHILKHMMHRLRRQG